MTDKINHFVDIQNVYAPHHESLQAQYSNIFNIPNEGALSLEELNHGYYAALKDELKQNSKTFIPAVTSR